MEKSKFKVFEKEGELNLALSRRGRLRYYVNQLPLEIAKLQGLMNLSHINFLSKYLNMIIIFHS